MKAKEFDKKFDDGEDISQYLDISKARRPGQEQKRVNVDFPSQTWTAGRPAHAGQTLTLTFVLNLP
jgi:hypothetical protein